MLLSSQESLKGKKIYIFFLTPRLIQEPGGEEGSLFEEPTTESRFREASLEEIRF